MPAPPFGPYRLEGVLGHGPTGTVHLARDTGHHDRVVALRIPAAHLAADPAFRDRFRRDAAGVAALGEPHVAPVHRYGEVDGVPFLDVRLVRGPTLEELLRAGPLPPGRARAVAEQIASAQAALHRCGLGARPIDPSDVLVTGGPGHEFVQLVGLGLGMPPVDPGRVTSPDELVVAPRPRRRRLVAAVLGAILVVAVLVAVLLVPRGEPGLVATLAGAGEVVDVDVGVLDDRPVLVAATAEGTVGVWDLATGRPSRPPIPVEARAVAATVLDGRAVAVLRDPEQRLRVHDLDTGVALGPPIGEPVPVVEPEPGSLVVGLSGGLDAVGNLLVEMVATGTGFGLQVRTLPGGELTGPPIAPPGGTVVDSALAVLDATPVAVVLTDAEVVQAVDLRTGALIGIGSPPGPTSAYALDLAQVDGTAVAFVGGADNVVRRVDVRTGADAGEPMTGHRRGLTAVQVVGEQVVTVGGGAQAGETAELRVWDAATGAARGAAEPGHPAAQRLLGTAVLDGRGVLDGRAVVVAGSDGQVTVWDLAEVAR